jgi:hypothetical protein
MVELVDYRVSYGECVGYCASVLTIDGFDIKLVQTSNSPDADVRRFTGKIKAAMSERIAAAAVKLEPETLRATYGTPDARDEGAVTVRIRCRTGVTQHSYSRGDPPHELAALDALLSPMLLGWIDGEPPDAVHFDQVP